MKYAVASFKLAICLAVLSAGPAFTQTTDEPTTKKPAPVAYIYVQTTPGVMVYAAAANGSLTTVAGSPFKVTGQMEDISGKHLIAVGTTNLYTYPIESNGAVGKRISTTNTADYGGSYCGTTSGQGSVFEHTGKYLYVQLNTNNTCAAWQTYQLESNGVLEFRGDTEDYDTDEYGNVIQSLPPTFSSSDKFAYGVYEAGEFTGNQYCEYYYEYCPNVASFVKTSNGELEGNGSFSQSGPEAMGGWSFYPNAKAQMQADPSGHLAVVMNQLDGYGDAYGAQLASFTIIPSTGAISSTNNWENMPTVYGDSGVPLAMSISPSGRYVAIGSTTGGSCLLQLFQFNAAAPPLYISSTTLSCDNIDQLKWDSDNHLYALSYDYAELYVFTVTPSNTDLVPDSGSPYYLPDVPYGTRGMVVIP